MQVQTAARQAGIAPPRGLHLVLPRHRQFRVVPGTAEGARGGVSALNTSSAAHSADSLRDHQVQEDPDFLRIHIYLTQNVDENMLANISINGERSSVDSSVT